MMKFLLRFICRHAGHNVRGEPMFWKKDHYEVLCKRCEEVAVIR